MSKKKLPKTENQTHNAANEILTNSTHDRNGNMMLMPGLRCVYDAWNRLVEARNAADVLIARYDYNGLNQRVRKTVGSTIATSFFNTAWQELEAQEPPSQGGGLTVNIWGQRYIDDLVLRERGSERLYSIADPNWNVVAVDNLGGQSTKSDMLPKAAFRFRPACCVLLSGGCFLAVTLLIIAFFVIVFLNNPSTYHPTRYMAVFVQDHEIQNIMQKLAGEWVIELPAASLIFPSGMKGWRETRFILNEDGTCEIHNLTLDMATALREPKWTRLPFGLKRQPALVGKTFSGTWESVPQSVSGHPEGSIFPTRKVYATIVIFGEKDHAIEDEYRYYCSGFLMVWRIRENGMYTYRLRMFDGHDEFTTDRCGIIFKRVE